MLSEITELMLQSQKDRAAGFPSQEIPKLQRQRGKWCLPGAGVRREGELSCSGYRVSVWEDKKVLEIGCTTTANVLTTTDLYT